MDTPSYILSYTIAYIDYHLALDLAYTILYNKAIHRVSNNDYTLSMYSIVLLFRYIEEIIIDVINLYWGNMFGWNLRGFWGYNVGDREGIV